MDYGDFWHPSQMGPEELSINAAYMRRYAASVGREHPPKLSCRVTLNFGNVSAGAERPPLHGTSEDIIGDMAGYAEAGVEHVIMEIAGESFDDKFRSMDRFVNEVKPKAPV